jgi:uncharacterized protein YbbC (DUF1343 family)
MTDRAGVVPGLEAGLEAGLEKFRGCKAGLITHAAGVSRRLRSAVDLLRENPGFELTALFAPEHGLIGQAQAGESVDFFLDPATGLPVYSLYRETFSPKGPFSHDPDARMRDFDTREAGKFPDLARLKEIDVMLCDLQDAGTRVYTYAATMVYALQACARADIPFVVLDRPNPVGGKELEGPMLDPSLRSFIGTLSIPLRHGLTMGEMAGLARETYVPEADLTVIPMRGWERSMAFTRTGLTWVPPSPNLPTPDSALVYPGQVLLEGTNLSEGRGTTRPFELFGAPWMDGKTAADDLNRQNLPGVIFREAGFKPTFSKFMGKGCGGCQLHVIDPEKFRPFSTTLHILRWAMDRHPGEFRFHAFYFDRAAGVTSLRAELEKGLSPRDITARIQPDLAKFRKSREPFLLY